MPDLNVWVRNQRELLAVEKEEETSQLREQIESSSAQQCQEQGITLLNLWAKDSRYRCIPICIYACIDWSNSLMHAVG